VGGRVARRRGDRPNRSGLTDRATESVGSGRVDQAKVGWQGQMGFGLFSQIELSLTLIKKKYLLDSRISRKCNNTL
jgi:hypothetical protein